ncbi:MAG: dihydrodipicolinate synthase family protein [Ardenticatenaceae bacterium]|nr:dihydrodipicolinate synthase family protein [Ardenticatenaceae bacterium]
MTRKREAKEWARGHLRGLWGVHWVPFGEDFSIDEHALRDHVRRVLDYSEMDGLSVAGMLAEPWYLSLKERMFVGEVVKDEIGGRLPAYFSATDHSLANTMTLVHHAEDLGFDMAMIWPPYEHAKSEDEIYRFYEYIDAHSDIAIAAYSTPHSGRVMNPELIAAVTGLESICAVKYVTWSFADYVRASALVENRAVISFPFEDQWLITNQYFGNQALFSTTAVNLFQSELKKPLVEYTRLAAAGNFKEAYSVFHDLQPLRQLWKEIYEVYPKENRHPYAETKYWAMLLGLLDDPRVRPPQNPVDPGVAEHMRHVLEREGFIHAKEAV